MSKDKDLFDEPNFGAGDENVEPGNPLDVRIPWDEHIDSRVPPVVAEEQGTVEDTGPPYPENLP